MSRPAQPARYAKGDVVVLPFPFSDLSSTKRRPALVVAPLDGVDLILCMITSQAVRDSYAIPLSLDDFTRGGLPKPSHIRPNRLFTADSSLIERSAGHLTSDKLTHVIDALVRLFRQA